MSKIPQGEWGAIAARYANGELISTIARSYGCTPPAVHYILKRNRQRAGETLAPPAARVEPAAALVRALPRREEPISTPPLVRSAPVLREPAVAQAPVRSPEPEAAAPGSVPGLDRALHHRAEAVIATFRSSFDAALTEASPVMRERLRQAASDLMRVAARTTMVLDRLNAGAVHSARAQNYPRSAHARDEAGESDMR